MEHRRHPENLQSVGARTLVLTAFLILPYFTCQAADRASWYGEKHRGLLMANGDRFDPDRLTAASWFYPFGTKVVVTHNHRSVVVEITDRGPAKRLVNAGRKIDLSRAAFAKLADPDVGLISVMLTHQANRPTTRKTTTLATPSRPAQGELYANDRRIVD